jgi:hypothetical protein
MTRRHLNPREAISAIARLLGASGGETLRIGGCLGFRVRGGGGGTWVVNLSVPGGDWHYDDDAVFASAGTRVHVEAREFAPLLTDPELAADAEARGELTIEGQRERWTRFLEFLAGAGPLLVASRVTWRGSSSRPA